MLNVNDLELRHKKYKRKYYAPLFTMIASLVIITASVTSFLFYNSKATANLENKTVQEPVIAQKIETAPVVAQKIETELVILEKNESVQEAVDKENALVATKTTEKEEIMTEEKQEKVVLAPSLGFMSKFESNNPSCDEPIKEIESLQKSQEKIETTQAEIIEPKIEPKKEEIEEVTINTDKKSSINIARNDEMEDIAHVIKRFNVNHNPALSLFVAKKYYQLGDYEQAYNYALITNDINNNIEESWLIFSKSLVKINKKEMAIETLKKYISHSHSSQARQLLDEIQAGKFK
ncbi:MAG: hypothetical protein QG617_1447 [Campylobacterota bacterium]|nr:hypothetical protein [Campylobacterota bacterium]